MFACNRTFVMYLVQIKIFIITDNLCAALPSVAIDVGDPILTVEIGGPVKIRCTGSSVFNDVNVSWIQMVNGQEKPGTFEYMCSSKTHKACSFLKNFRCCSFILSRLNRPLSGRVEATIQQSGVARHCSPEQYAQCFDILCN